MATAALPNLDDLHRQVLQNYDGRDPNLQENPACCVCYNEPGNLTCSRCQLVPYCSQDCQKKGFAEHKNDCKMLEKLQGNMEKEAHKLKSGQFGFGMGPPENAFEEHVGSFWGLFETRDYMRARLAVVDQIERMNWDLDTKRGWDMVAAHMLDMLRLNASDNIGLRFRFPFILINLNRDDDAYCFVSCWMQDWDSTYEEREKMHARSKEGDWLYPKEDGARFGDILEQHPDKKYHHKYTSLALLVACAVIKMRVVVALEAQKLREDASYDPDKHEKQKKMLLYLLDVIDTNNKSMLPALLYPKPLKDAGNPDYHTPGHPSEARMVLNDACRPWARIPGAEALLVARFGSHTPKYNTKMSL